MAEIASQYLKKGSPVYIEGRIQNRTYDDKEGNRRYISEVVARRLQLLGGRSSSSGSSNQEYSSDDSSVPETDDDLPF